MEDKISVIMATYNCEKTVDKAIQSILEQTHKNWVLIICDDGSSDGTYEILKRYESEDPERFLIIKNETNMKLPYSLNHCLQYVKTELVARMDADDWCLPERFEKQLAFLRAHPDVDLVSTGVTVSNGKERLASIIKEPYPTRETYLKTNAFSHATILTYKYVYDKLGGYSLDPSAIRVEDKELWYRFYAAGFKGCNMPDELYIILEDDGAVKRRTLRARWNGAKTASKGYRLLGVKGLKCYKPYLSLYKAFVPKWLYRIAHVRKLNKQRYT